MSRSFSKTRSEIGDQFKSGHFDAPPTKRISFNVRPYHKYCCDGGVMIRTLALMLLLAAPLTAQNDDAARARIAAGCGADEVHFDIKTDKKQHPTGTAEGGHALVAVFAGRSGRASALRQHAIKV